MDIKPRQLEVIEAAGQLVTEDGFAALTTKRLAERMHFTEAALYRHFASKEEILVTMLHHLAANIDERLAAVQTPQSPSLAWISSRSISPTGILLPGLSKSYLNRSKSR